MSNKREHAIVLGGSIAGLFAARVLSDHFERVTIIERDPVHDKPESRKGQRHTQHLHAVLAPAHTFVRDRLPQAYQNLLDGGAITVDSGEGVISYAFGGYSNPDNVTSGLQILNTSRPYFEYHIRCAVLAITNVSMMDNTKADNLLMNEAGNQVIGVQITHRDDNRSERLHADVVIDACGRGTPTPKWLSQLGYDVPEKEEVKINVGYVTRLFRRTAEQGKRTYLILGTPPETRVTGTMVPAEDDVWYALLTGFHGHDLPTNGDEYMEAVRNLPTQDIYNVISQSEPISELLFYKYPASRRFRYDQLDRFPAGFLPLGDSVASFNPVYGQGMSSAALQVEALDNLLQTNRNQDFWRIFFAQQHRVIDTVWTIVVGADFRYPETEGKRKPGAALISRYMKQVNLATQTDVVVATQMSQVVHLLDVPTSLFHPRIMWRVIRSAFRRTRSSEPVPAPDVYSVNA